jgi:AcrR family transcriptional regulator
MASRSKARRSTPLGSSAERRELILSKASELFAAKGIAATTVREIADEVGVLSGSLYHHFESKDAIVDEILNRYLAAICDRYDTMLADGLNPAERLYQLILASLQVAEDQPHASIVYQNEVNYLHQQKSIDMVRKRTNKIQNAWLAVIESGVKEGVFRNDVSPQVFLRLVRDAVWLAFRWHRSDRAFRADKLADDVARVFLGGMLTVDGATDLSFRQLAPATPVAPKRSRAAVKKA